MGNLRQKLFQKKLISNLAPHCSYSTQKCPITTLPYFLKFYFGNTDCSASRFCPLPNFIASCLVTLTCVKLVFFLNATLSFELI